MTSELSAPLLRRRDRAAKAKSGKTRHLPVARLAFAGIFVLLAAFALRIVFVDDPTGGQPFAEVPVHSTLNSNTVVGNTASGSPATIEVGPELPLDGAGSIITLDGAETRIADLPDDGAPLEAIADPVTGLVADLVEETEHGPIPRMSAMGSRPFDAYARPSVSPATADGKPLVAVIVTGLGLNTAGTLDAINTLPDAITLAFAPYGKTLSETTAAARNGGHELFLEVPLEPFDYPDNDPGPDTLLTGKPPRDNMSKLFAVMGKFGGYVGLINNMGARFTASGADFGPMMEELGARGLGYVDDGSSNRSLAQQLSSANKVPFARADLLLDANPSRAAILSQLALLEEKARTGSAAVGVISALPVSISTLAEWAKNLESRGFLLVPASALMK